MLAAALSTTDLARQAEKIEAFVNWSGMAANAKKRAVTGILWGRACRNGSDKVLSTKMMKMLQQRLEWSKNITHLSHSCTFTLNPTGILE
jgi:hypothetical protein